MEINIGGEVAAISPEILEKYNQPGPRYTSYPTAPEWTEAFGPDQYIEGLAEADQKTDAAPISLYVHLPFCESLCLFCGCNVVINKNHDSSIPYIESLKKEISWLHRYVRKSRKLEQVHWGGGTPSYLTPSQMEDLFECISDNFEFAPDAEIGIEVDPRVTTMEHCSTTRRLGFNRISMGIQDFSPLVQKTVRRIQPFEMTRELFDHCRDLEFESINIDLIYGLPHQTPDIFAETVEKIIDMSPDRIAVFSYAHVPWMKKQQGSFAKYLPLGTEKFRIFYKSIEMLTEAGYQYIGLDHFARPTDELCVAQNDRTLHRNFQGYTTKAGCDLIGAGVSSISGLDDIYAQNWRDLQNYYGALNSDRWATMRGVRVSAEDKLRRSVINRILCHCVVVKEEVEKEFSISFDEHFAPELERLQSLESDKLVRLFPDRLEVAALGRIFIRNVAMEFDEYLKRPESQNRQVFSKTL